MFCVFRTFQLKDGDHASALNRMSNRGRGCYVSADNIIGIHVRLGGVWHTADT